MADLAVDYSYARPTPAAVKAAGYVAVLRYLSGARRGDVVGKDLSVPERDALLNAGLDIGLVWETTAMRALEGFAAGAADAAAANAEADALGAPATMAIYYAVDGDVVPKGVLAYFSGVSSIAGRAVGVYGSFRVVEALVGEVVPFGWQTAAWSGTNISAKAHLYQRFIHDPPIAGVPAGSWDQDVILEPTWGSWRGAQPAATTPDPFVLLAAASGGS